MGWPGLCNIVGFQSLHRRITFVRSSVTISEKQQQGGVVEEPPKIRHKAIKVIPANKAIDLTVALAARSILPYASL
jgi:hypothetical protein